MTIWDIAYWVWGTILVLGLPFGLICILISMFSKWEDGE